MNKLSSVFLVALVVMVFESCATMVQFDLEHPPLVDMRGMETITVIPLTWKNDGSYGYLANDLTRTLTNGIKQNKTYQFVEPSKLRNIDKSGYWEHIDVFIEGTILSVSTDDETDIREEKDGDKTTTKEYVIRTVTVTFEYKYFRATDNVQLGSFVKSAKDEKTFDNSSRSSKWWEELLLDIFLPRKGPSETDLAKSAIRQFSPNMSIEVNPYKTTEKRKIAKSTNKDPIFKEAEKQTKRKNYFEALMLYKNIYEQTGSITAGYNMALLLEANNQFPEALALLEEIDSNISKTGINSPPVIKEEMEKLKVIINDLAILGEYRNQ